MSASRESIDFQETSKELWKVDADKGPTVLCRIWMPEDPKAILVAVHGGLAHSGDWVTPALFFKERRIGTYAFDLRHHGTYSLHNRGKDFLHIDSFDTYLHDLKGFIDWIESRHPKLPLFIIGHSLGSLISLLFGLKFQIGIKGVIVSSPWLQNKVKVPGLLLSFSKILNKIWPTFSIKPEPITDHLTHDQDIYRRHLRDEEVGLRGSKVSARFGQEAFKAQRTVRLEMGSWHYPLFAVIAGDDYLADPKVSLETLAKVLPNLIHLEEYETNFHENFNEVNRVEIFNRILKWIGDHQ